MPVRCQCSRECARGNTHFGEITRVSLVQRADVIPRLALFWRAMRLRFLRAGWSNHVLMCFCHCFLKCWFPFFLMNSAMPYWVSGSVSWRCFLRFRDIAMNMSW